MEKTINTTDLIPEGYEFEREKSTIDKLVIKMRTAPVWGNVNKINGFYTNSFSLTFSLTDYKPKRSLLNTFVTKQQALSALAFAQLTQVMQAFFKPFTAEEWRDANIIKYCIYRYNNSAKFCTSKKAYHFLAFRTPAERLEFFRQKENVKLVNEYQMNY